MYPVKRRQRIGEGREILDLRGTRLADVRRSYLDDARSESIHRRPRARPRGGRRLVDANRDVGRQFAGDLVQHRGNRALPPLEFRAAPSRESARGTFSRAAHDQAIDFETNPRHARDSGKQDRRGDASDTPSATA